MHVLIRALFAMILQATSGVPSIVTLIIPILIGTIAAPIYQGLKSAVTFVNNLPSWLHPILVTLLSYGLTLLASLLKIQLSTTDFGSLSATDVSTILSGLAAIIAHQIWKTSTGTANSTPVVAAAISSATTSAKASP